MRSLLKLTIFSVTLALLAGCGTSPEEARQKLADLNVEYTEESFAEHAGRGDMQAVDLFLKAGMDPNHAMPAAFLNNRSQVIQTLEEAGAKTFIPEARPMIALIQAVKSRDLEQFKSVFSAEQRREAGFHRQVRAARIAKKIEKEWGEERMDYRNYEFDYEGGNRKGKLTIIYKGKESEDKQEVVKEKGIWRIDERL